MSETNNPNILGEQLKKIRTKKNLSQKDLAELLGVTPASLSAYETGKKKPSLNVLIDIAKKCDVSLDWLCGLSQYENNLNDIKTYSDVINLLLQISKTKLLSFGEVCETISTGPLFEDTAIIKHTGISFIDNNTLNLFIDDFKKMYNLYLDNSIDEDVYNLWIEKTLIKYDFLIDYDDLPFWHSGNS